MWLCGGHFSVFPTAIFSVTPLPPPADTEYSNVATTALRIGCFSCCFCHHHPPQSSFSTVTVPLLPQLTVQSLETVCLAEQRPWTQALPLKEAGVVVSVLYVSLGRGRLGLSPSLIQWGIPNIGEGSCPAHGKLSMSTSLSQIFSVIHKVLA